MSEEKQTSGYRDEIPFQEIQEAIGNGHHEVVCRVRRRQPNGQFGSVGPYMRKPTQDLASAEDWLRKLAGGGTYLIDALDVNDQTQFVVPKFKVSVEGNARPLQPIRDGLREPRGEGFGSVYVLEHGEDNREPHRDAVAVGQLNRSEARLERIERRYQESEERHQQELRALQDKVREDERRHAQELQRQEREANQRLVTSLESKLSALETRLANPPRPAFDATAIVGVVTGIVPLFVAMVEAGKSKQELALSSQQKSMEFQLGTLTTMLGSKKDDSPLITAMMPLLQSMMEEKSPSKMAELVSAFAESNLTSLSMLAELAKQNMPDDNPWADAIRSAIDTTVESLKRAMPTREEPRRGLNGGARPQQLQPRQAGNPKEIADAIYQSPELPQDLRTREWYQIFYYLHAKEHPEKVAKRIADLLNNLRDHGQLPEIFGQLFDSKLRPSEHLAQLVDNLPISQIDKRYADAVLDAFDACFVLQDEPTQPGSPRARRREPRQPARPVQPPRAEESEESDEDEAGEEEDGDEEDGNEDEADAEVIGRDGEVFKPGT